MILGSQRGQTGGRGTPGDWWTQGGNRDSGQTPQRQPEIHWRSGGKGRLQGTQKVYPAIELWVSLIFKSDRKLKQSGELFWTGVGTGLISWSRLPPVSYCVPFGLLQPTLSGGTKAPCVHARPGVNLHLSQPLLWSIGKIIPTCHPASSIRGSMYCP